MGTEIPRTDNKKIPTAEFKNWAECRELLPHVGSLYESELFNDESVKEWGWVLHEAARYMQAVLSKYAEAEQLHRRALEGRKKELGERHPNTLTNESNLAIALRDQRKYSEAERLHRRALELAEGARRTAPAHAFKRL